MWEGYSVSVQSAPGTVRHFFNGRACRAYYESGTPVRINTVTFAN